MQQSDVVAEYEKQMERLVTAYKARMILVCKAGELTPPQFFALFKISGLTRTKMSPLADELCLSMGAASTLVDRLVTRGLVGRDADASDRRAVFVSLSEKGHRVLEDAKAARREILGQVFDHLSPAQRRDVVTSLDALAGAWEALGPVSNPGLGCMHVDTE